MPYSGSILDERLILAADERPVDRLREQDVVVPAEIGVGLLAGQDQEVGVGVAAAALEVGLQLLQPERAGVVGMTVAVEVEDVGDVDAQVAASSGSRAASCRGCRIEQLLGERRVEVRHHRLVARQRLVAVAVGERHDRLAAGVRRRRGSGRSRPAIRCQVPGGAL